MHRHIRGISACTHIRVFVPTDLRRSQKLSVNPPHHSAQPEDKNIKNKNSKKDKFSSKLSGKK